MTRPVQQPSRKVEGYRRMSHDGPSYQEVLAERQAEVVRRVRSLAAKTGKGGDEPALDALAEQIAKLITWDRAANAAIIRELLPAYIAARFTDYGEPRS